MPVIKLIPSSYGVSNTTYISVSNAKNMYHDTNNTTYARFYNNRTQTTTYYGYIRGFNIDDIPSSAIINSFTIRIKGYETGGVTSTSTSYAICLVNGNTALTGTYASTQFSTSVDTITVPSGDLTWSELAEYGNNLGIRICCRRSNRNTACYVYVYGAEIEVNYTIPIYHQVTATSEINDITITPVINNVVEGSSQEFIIKTGSYELSDFVVEDNGNDVTDQLVQHTVSGGTIERYPANYSTSGSISGTNYQSAIGKGSNTSNSSGSDYASGGSSSTAYINYSFDFSDIPTNATIESVSVSVKGHCESTSNYSEVATLQLYSGSIAKGSESEFTSTSDTVITMSPGSWTRAELQNAILRFTIGYYGGKVVGATWTVTYSVETSTYYTYTISNIQTDHDIVITQAGAFIPPEEDPEKTYYPITISSINATTDPKNGTTRVESGTNQVVTITPSDPQLTLALDNGVDITSQLVGGIPQNTYTVTTQVSGADYGFYLNSSTGYYVSSNDGVNKSASVARLNLNFESDCLITINYINYAEENYDYGMFGKLDTAVATDGLTAGNSSSYPSDSTSNYQLAMCANLSSVQTITYEVPAGEHFIDIKYGKDDASKGGNDNLQWKVANIEATSAGGEYTYTLTNITEKHSLIFIFGDVTYYFITSSGNCKLFPDGQYVVLPGDNYKINIIPNNITDTVTITDNGSDVTSMLEREDGYDKNNNPAVSYKYSLSNIQATHTLVISCTAAGQQDSLFFKYNNNWIQVIKVWVKKNNVWEEEELTYISDEGLRNIRKG